LASDARHVTLDAEFAEKDDVLDTATVLKYLTADQLAWRMRSGRWQQPARGVVIAHSGPLSEEQTLRVAVLWGGARAAIAGLTAAWLDGFTGFGDRQPFRERPIYLVLPPGRNARQSLPGVNVVRHYSRMLGPDDVHPMREPPRTRLPRSLVDAAAWMVTERGTLAVLAAGVQQGKVRVDDLGAVVARNPRLRRRKLIADALGDIAGGAQALSELDFTRQVVRRHGLPEPEMQMARRDRQGRRRYIDVTWEKWKVMVEIDGAQHMEAQDWWADMERDNDFNIDGYRLLRFPAWVVRRRPEYVAQKVREALRKAGCPC
jgi:very-short-patch-repair endonuclease